MGEMRSQIVALNIARYERLLQTETDPKLLCTLRSLLKEAREEAKLLKEQDAIEKADYHADTLRQEAKRLRMRAEEYRSIADATASDAARNSYLNLARNYEMLAERLEENRTGEAGAAPKSA